MKKLDIRPIWIICLCALCILTGCPLLLAGCAVSTAPLSQSGFFLDTVIQVTIYDSSKEACLTECMSLADKYEKLFSTEIEGSDIWNINHSGGKPITVCDETITVINTALTYCDITNGRIDLTIESVSRLWDFHQDSAEGVTPDKESISKALKHVNYHNISINGNTITLTDPDASISLGFIAKGYIADKMKEYLISQNVKSAIINLGGNLLAVGSKPDGTAFQFGIQKPFDTRGAIITSLPVSDRSLVSSGIYERYFYQNDVLYHHILDPAAGYPVQNNLLSVTIISDSSMEGDALSTSCFVLGLEEGLELIESLDNVEAVFITDDYELHYSSGLF